VINFDFPNQIEDYVHRVGRTGRAGAHGIAYTFFTEENGKFAKELIDVLEEAKQTIPRELEQLAERNSYLRKRPANRWQKPTGGRNDSFNRNDRGKSNGYGQSYGSHTNSYSAPQGTNNAWPNSSNTNGNSYAPKYPTNFSWNQNGGHLYQQPYTAPGATNGTAAWNAVPSWNPTADVQKQDVLATAAYPMCYYPTVQAESVSKDANSSNAGYYTFAPPSYDFTPTTVSTMATGSTPKPEPPTGIPPAKPKGRFSGGDGFADQQSDDNSKSNPVLVE